VLYTLIMENFPKRGRPRKIPRSGMNAMADKLAKQSPEKQAFAREHFAEAIRSDRTRANAYYADGATEVVETYAKQAKEQRIAHDPVGVAKLRRGLDWILARKTVLTELGRMMDSQDPTEENIERLQAVVRHIATRHDKLTAKSACAYIRGRRMGETKRKDRIASLHHDLNAAINLHRQRFPGSTWDEIRRALALTAGQIEHKRT
jgi:hypothetical protein